MADIREKTPVKSKAAAGGAGHNGAALATVFLQEDEAKIRSDLKKLESMKDRLRKLTKLTADDHKEFRATMGAKREEMQAAAKTAGFSSLQDYFTKGGNEGKVAASLQATVSLWTKLSTACEKGTSWIDYDMAWADISAKATEFNRSAGSNGAAATTGAKRASLIDKSKNFVKGNMMGADGKLKAEMVTPQEVKIGEKTVQQIPLVESILMMLTMADAPDSVLDELVAKVNEYKHNRQQAREAAAKATAKASASSAKSKDEKKETQRRSATGNPSTEEVLDRAKAISRESTKNSRRPKARA